MCLLHGALQKNKFDELVKEEEERTQKLGNVSGSALLKAEAGREELAH